MASPSWAASSLVQVVGTGAGALGRAARSCPRAPRCRPGRASASPCAPAAARLAGAAGRSPARRRDRSAPRGSRSTTRASWTTRPWRPLGRASSGASMPDWTATRRPSPRSTVSSSSMRRRGDVLTSIGRDRWAWTASSATTVASRRSDLCAARIARTEGQATHRYRRRRRGLSAAWASCDAFLATPLRARRHRRPGRAHEGHRALLRPVRLPLAQRRVEVGGAAGRLRDRAGRRRTTSSPTS